MVIQGHTFQTAFVIKDAQGASTLGFGRLLAKEPSIYSTESSDDRETFEALSCI